MSYILEGFKKLERGSQRIGAKGFFSASGNTPPGRDKRKWQKYIPVAAVVLLLVIAAGAYWWYSASTFSSSGEQLQQGQVEAEPENQQPPADEPQRDAIQVEQKPMDPPLVEKQEHPIAEADRIAMKSSRRKEPNTGGEEPADSPATEEAAAHPSGEKIVPFNQLPDDVKKSMPEMKVFLHYYSPERKERFVQINEHTLHEGQSRPDGLKVLQITQQAAIFSYQGHRFQMRAIEK